METISLFALKSVCEFLELYDYRITRVKIALYRYNADKNVYYQYQSLLFDDTAKLYEFVYGKYNNTKYYWKYGKPVVFFTPYNYANDNHLSEEIMIPKFDSYDYYSIIEMSLNKRSNINNTNYQYDVFYDNYNKLNFIDKSEIKKSIISKMNVILKDENKKQLRKTMKNLELFLENIKDLRHNHNKLDADGNLYDLKYFDEQLKLIYKNKNSLHYMLFRNDNPNIPQ